MTGHGDKEREGGGHQSLRGLAGKFTVWQRRGGESLGLQYREQHKTERKKVFVLCGNFLGLHTFQTIQILI